MRTPPRPQYLQKRGQVYRFRARVPQLNGYSTLRREVARSLETSDIRVAKQILPTVWAAWNRAMAMMNSIENISAEQIESICRQFVRAEIDEYHDLFTRLADVQELDEARKATLHWHQLAKSMIVKNMAGGRHFHLAASVEDFLENEGLSFRRDSRAYERLMQQAQRKWLVEFSFLNGGSSRKDRTVERDGIISTGDERKSGEESAEAVKPNDKNIMAPWRCLELEYFKDRPSIGDSSKKSHVQAFNELENLIGSKPLTEVQQADIKKYADYLRDKKIVRAGAVSMSHSTINKKLSHIRGYFGYAVEIGSIAKNPAQDVKPRTRSRGERKSQLRQALSEEQLTILTESPIFTGFMSETRRHIFGEKRVKDEKYFFMATALFSGARVGELALAPSKLVRLGDVWCIDLREVDTKTTAGARLIPIIPALERLGFLDYAKSREERGEKLLFGGDKRAWSKWGNRYLDQIGLSNHNLTLHSLRHNYRQMLRASGISEELANKVFGHDNGSAGSGYGRALSSAEAKLVYERVKPHIEIQ